MPNPSRSFKTSFRSVSFLSVFLLMLFSGALLPLYAKTIVLEGTPVNVKQSGPQGLREGPATPEEQAHAKVVLSKEGDKYFWDSNGSGEMIRKDKEKAYYFIDLQGKGFIEVILDEKSGKYYYMESRSSEGITYYGVAEFFLKE